VRLAVTSTKSGVSHRGGKYGRGMAGVIHLRRRCNASLEFG
jgi:hypothetical protein